MKFDTAEESQTPITKQVGGQGDQGDRGFCKVALRVRARVTEEITKTLSILSALSATTLQ